MNVILPGQRENIRRAIARSEVTLREAELLLQQGFYHGAAQRAYYGAFHAATAALLSKGLEFARHAAVIAHFGKEFVKTGLLDPKYHQTLIEAFDLRQKADYDYTAVIEEELARRLTRGCRELLEAVRTYLKREGFLD